MNRSKMMLLCVCFLGLTPLLLGQNGNRAVEQGRAAGVLGYLDPQTGAFRPVPRHASNEVDVPDVTTTETGKFVFKFTITIESSIPSGFLVGCGASADTFDVGRESSYTESAGTPAAVTGSTATCTVTIPYSWPMSTPTMDSVNLSYDVVIYNPNATNSKAAVSRDSSHTINPSFAVPPIGQTTTVSVAATV